MPDVSPTTSNHRPAPANGASTDPATLVRRALLASARELDTALGTTSPHDRRRHKALDRWFAGYAEQLRRHLQLVDALVLPALSRRGALPAADLDALAEDHAWIDQLVSDLGDALGVLSFDLGSAAWWLGRAHDLAGTLAHVLQVQFGHEDELLTPLLVDHLTDDELEMLRVEVVDAVASGPVRFSLAWLRAHVSTDDWAALASYTSAASRLLGLTARGAYARSALAALR
mgnify:CR=1 FL=1